MNKKQENEFTMMLVVKEFAGGQTAITSTLPNFSTFFNILLTCITNIQTFRDIQEGDKTGVTSNKNDLRAAVIAIALDYVDRLVAFAKITKNKALESEVYFTKSDLESAADTILKDRVQLLYNRAQSNLSSLASYFIVAATQTAFQTAINAYAAAIPKPSLAYNDKQTAGENIALNIKNALDALKTMDALVRLVRTSQPNFYSGWQKSREIPKSGSGSLAFKALVVDTNKQPIHLASIEITSSAPNAPTFSRKSSQKGNCQIQNLVEGKYTATISKAGYVQKIVPFNITSGERTALTITLESDES